MYATNGMELKGIMLSGKKKTIGDYILYDIIYCPPNDSTLIDEEQVSGSRRQR